MIRSLVAVALLSLTGCSAWSNWIYAREGPPGKSTTEVTIVTDPPGAEISINGKYLGESPLIVPVRYAYDMRIFVRRKTVPPELEEKRVKIYTENEFVFSAYSTGYRRAKTTIFLHGEALQQIHLTLTPKKRPTGLPPEEEEEREGEEE